jgi:hypothetical protein
MIISTIKKFKSYESWSAATFILSGLWFAYDIDFLPMVIAFCASVWVFTSSGWRQSSQEK